MQDCFLPLAKDFSLESPHKSGPRHFSRTKRQSMKGNLTRQNRLAQQALLKEEPKVIYPGFLDEVGAETGQNHVLTALQTKVRIYLQQQNDQATRKREQLLGQKTKEDGRLRAMVNELTNERNCLELKVRKSISFCQAVNLKLKHMKRFSWGQIELGGRALGEVFSKTMKSLNEVMDQLESEREFCKNRLNCETEDYSQEYSDAQSRTNARNSFNNSKAYEFTENHERNQPILIIQDDSQFGHGDQFQGQQVSAQESQIGDRSYVGEINPPWTVRDILVNYQAEQARYLESIAVDNWKERLLKYEEKQRLTRGLELIVDVLRVEINKSNQELRKEVAQREALQKEWGHKLKNEEVELLQSASSSASTVAREVGSHEIDLDINSMEVMQQAREIELLLQKSSSALDELTAKLEMAIVEQARANLHLQAQEKEIIQLKSTIEGLKQERKQSDSNHQRNVMEVQIELRRTILELELELQQLKVANRKKTIENQAQDFVKECGRKARDARNSPERELQPLVPLQQAYESAKQFLRLSTQQIKQLQIENETARGVITRLSSEMAQNALRSERKRTALLFRMEMVRYQVRSLKSELAGNFGRAVVQALRSPERNNFKEQVEQKILKCERSFVQRIDQLQQCYHSLEDLSISRISKPRIKFHTASTFNESSIFLNQSSEKNILVKHIHKYTKKTIGSTKILYRLDRFNLGFLSYIAETDFPFVIIFKSMGDSIFAVFATKFSSEGLTKPSAIICSMAQNVLYLPSGSKGHTAAVRAEGNKLIFGRQELVIMNNQKPESFQVNCAFTKVGRRYFEVEKQIVGDLIGNRIMVVEMEIHKIEFS